MKPRPRIVLLDLLSTLVHDPFYVDVPAFFGMSLEELIACKHPTAWQAFERGRIDERTFLDSFFADGRDYDQEGMLACMRASYRWIDGMRELVEELAASGVPLVALSNYSEWYRLIDAELGLARFMSLDLVSCHTGWRKPAHGAFMYASATLGVDPEELMFIDDRDVNCRVARRCGLDAVRFESAQELRRQLAERELPS